MDVLYDYIEKFASISDESWNALQDIFKVKHFLKGTMLCDFNTVPKDFYFIISGYARAYSIDVNGKEFNLILYSPYRFAGSFSSIIERTKATLAIECLTDCKVLVFNYKDFMSIINEYSDIGIFYRKLIEYYLVKLQTYVINIVTISASERYKYLQMNLPGIEKHINQYHIASHLGITPIQLSRIRKDLLKLKK